MSDVGCICTCARARPFSISRERLVGLHSNLVCFLPYLLDNSFRQVKGGVHLHVHTCSPFFKYHKRLGKLRLNLAYGYRSII